jgi:hypothetical protein
MVQFRVIDRRTKDGKSAEQRFREMTDEVQRAALVAVAEQLADNTWKLGRDGNPVVDTGTYARSHRVRLRSGSAAPTRSSQGRPRGVFPGPPIAAGLRQMEEDIAGLPSGAQNVVFFNESLHAKNVEREGWIKPSTGEVIPAYRVYATTQSQAPSIIQRVVQEVMARRGSA